jgi:hypothetical protein
MKNRILLENFYLPGQLEHPLRFASLRFVLLRSAALRFAFLKSAPLSSVLVRTAALRSGRTQKVS